MTLKGHGKFYKREGAGYLYISWEIVNDSAFPLSHKQKVRIKVEGRKLIVEGD